MGTYFEAGDTSFVKVDGTTFHEPISVGDPGAKGARPGDKVAIEIVQYPSPYREGEGVIVEILGQRGQPGVDTLSVIRAFNIPDTFDEAVLEEAREQARLFDEAEIGSRRRPPRACDSHDRPGDRPRLRRRHLAFDATKRGTGRLGVHIADVAHFVRPGSPLDRVAREPGNQRLSARPRDSHASRDSVERPGQPAGRPNPIYGDRTPGL